MIVTLVREAGTQGKSAGSNTNRAHGKQRASIKLCVSHAVISSSPVESLLCVPGSDATAVPVLADKERGRSNLAGGD